MRRGKFARDPRLGLEVDHTTGRDRCSRCNEPIGEDAVPLMLWNESGERMWVYCEACSGSMLRTLVLARRDGTA